MTALMSRSPKRPPKELSCSDKISEGSRTVYPGRCVVSTPNSSWPGVMEWRRVSPFYEPTLLCNLHCSFCYVADILNPEDWRSKELSLEELDRVFVKGGVKSI